MILVQDDTNGSDISDVESGVDVVGVPELPCTSVVAAVQKGVLSPTPQSVVGLGVRGLEGF